MIGVSLEDAWAAVEREMGRPVVVHGCDRREHGSVPVTVLYYGFHDDTGESLGTHAVVRHRIAVFVGDQLPVGLEVRHG
jgi:hypothetical protein